MREYIVTLKNKQELDNFYDDIETVSSSNNFVPTREVEVVARRPISRNTHYYLTDDEAAALKNDPRVENVSLTMSELGIERVPYYIQTGPFPRNNIEDPTHLNWGLYRHINGVVHTDSDPKIIVMPLTGKNVDVVIVDGTTDRNHPEYAVNPDGSGGSRMIYYDWINEHQDVSQSVGISGTYSYTNFSGSGNSHGSHVMGTVAGNTQGWARDANIYNINPYISGNENDPVQDFLWDYIRAFHANKPINPLTGRQNPTVSNHSYGYRILGQTTFNGIYSLTYRGTRIFSNDLSPGDLVSYKLNSTSTGSTVYPWHGFRFLPDEADIIDAIADGIIVVAAGGNENGYVAYPGHPDYNNRYDVSGGLITYYYCQGSTPGAVQGVICVGAMDEGFGFDIDIGTYERKSSFSVMGPRMTIFSAGSEIQSSVNTSFYGGNPDPRNSRYYLAKISGTSMASPQVCGFLACILEKYPWMTQKECIRYLYETAKNDLPDVSSSWGVNIFDTYPRVLTWRETKPLQKQSYPNNLEYLRNQKEYPENGDEPNDLNRTTFNKQMYPRLNLRVDKRYNG